MVSQAKPKSDIHKPKPSLSPILPSRKLSPSRLVCVIIILISGYGCIEECLGFLLFLEVGNIVKSWKFQQINWSWEIYCWSFVWSSGPLVCETIDVVKWATVACMGIGS